MSRLAVVALALSLVGIGCGASGAAASPGASGAETSARGAQATDFTARDIDGKTVRLSDYLG